MKARCGRLRADFGGLAPVKMYIHRTRSVVVVVHRFDITALVSAVEQTHCTLVVCDSQ